MFTVCVGLSFDSKNMKVRIICSFQHSINIRTVEVAPTQIHWKLAKRNSKISRLRLAHVELNETCSCDINQPWLVGSCKQPQIVQSERNKVV